MPTHLVNLEALIPRQDFRYTSPGQEKAHHGKERSELTISELVEGYPWVDLLRKPDFQRETADWSPERVAEFVNSFANGDLIPSLIMWWSRTCASAFVIDGCHRLSALIAWVADDYGDGDYSKRFFAGRIPIFQMELADKTRRLIHEKVGNYKDLSEIARDQNTAPSKERYLFAREVIATTIGLQWVKGNAESAEQSFFRINGNQSPIDRTELGILQARFKPNAIATRAIVRAGTGHKYWEHFPHGTALEIEKQAKYLHNALFHPELEDPLVTLDLPLAGPSYSGESFKMVFDLVNLLNNVTDAQWRSRASIIRSRSKRLEDDSDGEVTLQFMKAVKSVMRLITGDGKDESGALGIHPAVYCYGVDGRHQPHALLATFRFFKDLKSHNQFLSFSKVRRDFEEFLVRNRSFLSQLRHIKGGRHRSVSSCVRMYEILFEQLGSGVTENDKIVAAMRSEEMLKKLDPEATAQPTTRKKHSKADKSAAYLRHGIEAAPRCPQCGARMHRNSMTVDHTVPKRDGGAAGVDNARHMHPFCNSGYKEHLASRAAKR